MGPAKAKKKKTTSSGVLRTSVDVDAAAAR